MVETYNDRLRIIKDKFVGCEPVKETAERNPITSYQDLLTELGRQISQMNQLLNDIEDVI